MNNRDGLGNKVGETYSLILTDPTFERRLKSFDPDLKLMFDQVRKRWCILQWVDNVSGWNLLITAEDSNGNPKPLGEWIFNKLYVWRHNYEVKMRDPNKFFDDLMYEADVQKQMIELQASLDHQNKLKDDIVQWRKASRELKNMPASDVTAGYPKTNYKEKQNAHNGKSV